MKYFSGRASGAYSVSLPSTVISFNAVAPKNNQGQIEMYVPTIIQEYTGTSTIRYSGYLVHLVYQAYSSSIQYENAQITTYFYTYT